MAKVKRMIEEKAFELYERAMKGLEEEEGSEPISTKALWEECWRRAEREIEHGSG